MALWTHRLPDDLASRFDGLATHRGGRSALLRQLIEQAVRDGEPAVEASPSDKVAVPPADKITIRLRPLEVAQIDRAARVAGVRRTQWLVSLVRARLSSTVPLPDAERLSVRALAAEFRGVVAELRATIRTTGMALREASSARVELEALEGRLAEVVDLEVRLRGLLQRNLLNWTGETNPA